MSGKNCRAVRNQPYISFLVRLYVCRYIYLLGCNQMLAVNIKLQYVFLQIWTVSGKVWLTGYPKGYFTVLKEYVITFYLIPSPTGALCKNKYERIRAFLQRDFQTLQKRWMVMFVKIKPYMVIRPRLCKFKKFTPYLKKVCKNEVSYEK